MNLTAPEHRWGFVLSEAGRAGRLRSHRRERVGQQMPGKVCVREVDGVCFLGEGGESESGRQRV